MSEQNPNLMYLSNVRLSFPHIIEPQKRKNDEGIESDVWNCELIMEPNHPGYAEFMNIYSRLAGEEWKEFAQNAINMIHGDRKQRCYGEGSEKINQKTFQPYDGYQGMVYISTSRSSRPQIIKPNGDPVDPVNTMEYQNFAKQMYGGCRVNAAIKPWLQDNKHGKGVRCELIALQFFKDDAPFGEGAVDASGMFGAVQQAPSGTPTPGGAPLPGVTGAPTPGMPGMPSFMK